MAEPKTERLSVRVTPEEKRMAAELAEDRHVDIGDVVRMLIHEEYAKRPKKKPKS